MAGYTPSNKKYEHYQRLRPIAAAHLDRIVTQASISRDRGIEALLLLLAEADRALDEPVRAQDQVQPNDLQGPAYLGGTAVGPAYASDPVWLAFLNAVHVAAQRLREPPSAVFTRLFALVERRHKVA
jgi:hypothetical protein